MSVRTWRRVDSATPARRRALFAIACCVALGSTLPAPQARADPTPGFTETWPGTSLENWMGGDGRRVVHKSNPGTGGVGGDGDGFLLFSTAEDPGAPHESTGNLGIHSGFENPDYAGDWIAAGIDSVSFWLRDVNLDEDVEIHFCIGRTGNIWQSNAGFHPPANAWADSRST